MKETISAVFSLEELWLMQACVRHETAQAEQWKFPPASLPLNDAIASAILFCEEQAVTEAAVLLSRHDCLVLDYNVPSSAKDVYGKPIGKAVLLKSFKARQQLEEELSLSETSGEEIDVQTIRERLADRARQGRSDEHA